MRLLYSMAYWELFTFFWIVWMGLTTLKRYNWQNNYVSYLCHACYV